MGHGLAAEDPEASVFGTSCLARVGREEGGWPEAGA